MSDFNDQLSDNKRKLLGDLESEWMNKTWSVLFNNETLKKIKENKLNINKVYAKDIDSPYVCPYRRYNSDSNNRFLNSPGYTKINDIVLTVPPESIAINMDVRTIDLPVLRSKGSIKINTGYGETSMSMRVFFTDNVIYPEFTLENELKYKMVPLLMQLRTMPFCKVENEYIKSKIYHKIHGHQYNQNEHNEAIMFTYQSHSVSTHPDSPRIIVLELNFLLFNYKPYIAKLRYADRYPKLQTTKELIRDDEGKFDNASFLVNPTLEPEDSLPFYEFFAEDFKNLYGGSREFKHFEGSERLELGYIKYTAIPKKYISAEMYKKVKAGNTKYKAGYNSTAYASSVSPSLAALGKDKLVVPVTAPKDIVIFNQRIDDKLQGMFNESAKEHNVPVNLLKAISYRESRGNVNAVNNTLNKNKTWDAGIMQINQSNAERNRWTKEYLRQHPEVCIDYGAKLLKEAMDNFKDLRLAVMCYNVGLTSMNNKKKNGSIDIVSAVNQLEKPEAMVVYVSEILGCFAYLEQTTLIVTKNEYMFDTDVTGVNAVTQTKSKKAEFVDADRSNKSNSTTQKPATPITNSQTTATKTDDTDDTIPKDEKGIIDYYNALLNNKELKYDLIQPFGDDGYIYMREGKSVLFEMGGGLQISAITSMGASEIPRITISGFDAATHQYMGGHVEKISMSLIVSGSDGEAMLRNIITIFDIANANARKFSAIASFDGVKITNPFINMLYGDCVMVLDDIQTQTHPDIPNGSIVNITATDFTSMKRSAHFAYDLEQVERAQGVDVYYKDLIRTAIGVAGIELWYTVNEPLKTRIESDIDMYNETSGKIDDFLNRFQANTLNAGESLLGGYGAKPIGMSTAASWTNLTTEPLNNYTKVQVGLKKYNIQVLSTWQIDKFKDSSFHNAFQELSDILNLSVINPSIDKFDVSDILRNKFKRNPKRKSDYSLPISINYVLGKIGDYAPSGKQYEDTGLSDALYGWAEKYSALFRKSESDEFKALREKYTDKYFESIDFINTPAYRDMNLPPSIDPDYYFYQPTKMSLMPSKDAVILEKVWKDMKEYDTKTRTQFDVNSQGFVLHDVITAESFKELYGYMPGEYSRSVSSDEYYQPATGAAINQGYDSVDVKNGDIILRSKSTVNKEDNQTNAKSNPSAKESIVPSRGKEIFYADSPDLLSGDLSKNDMLPFYLNSGRVSLYDMARCFPTFKVYIIEEDSLETLGWLRRKDLNDLFGLNAIQEIRFTSSADDPIDLAIIRFVDLTGKFTSSKYTDKPYTETKNQETLDTKQENPLEGLILREGTTIQLRAGYTNNINELPIIFNGEIVSINGMNNEYEMICQSFGAEMVKEIKGTQKDDITDFNAETKEVLHWCVSQPEMKHFGLWKLVSNQNLQYSGSRLGIDLSLMPYYQQTGPDGKRRLVWDRQINSSDMNILAPEESEWIGLEQFTDHTLESPWSTLLEVGKNIITPWNYIQWCFTDYVVYNQTVWDVAQEMTMRYPGYIVRPVPFGDRMTLYYGPLNGSYFHRPFTFLEQELISEINNSKSSEKLRELYGELESLRKDMEDEKATFRSIVSPTRWDMMKLIFLNGVAGPLGAVFGSPVFSGAKGIEIVQRNMLEIKAKQEGVRAEVRKVTGRPDFIGTTYDVRRRTIKPFRSFWLATSEGNIVKNAIKADYRDSYNQLYLSHNDMEVDKSEMDNGGWRYDTLSYPMNVFTTEEEIRSKQVGYANCCGKKQAFTYGVCEFIKEAGKLYKGSLVMTGEPRMKPFDQIHVYDDSTQTYGAVNVRRHILSISPGEGMVSDIEPEMVAYIKDTIGDTVNSGIGIYKASKRASDWLDTDSANWIDFAGNAGATAGIAGGAVSATAMVSGTTLGFISTPAAVVGFPLLAIAALQLRTKQLLALKYRDPILLAPLMRGGVPYINGCSSYKIAGLYAYIEHEFKEFGNAASSLSNTFFNALKLTNSIGDI